MVAAAEALGVSHGAVSRQITRLEAIVGQGLFERTARGLVLTPAGRSLASSVSDGFRQVRSGLDLLRAEEGGSLRVLAPANLSLRWIAPRLSRLSAVIAPHRLDLVAQNIDDASGDVVLRWYPTGPLPMGAVTLFEDGLFPVAAPALAARLNSPADLAKVPRLGFSASPDWSHWASALGLPPDSLRPTAVVSDSSITFEAAAAGDGVALARMPLVIADLQAGRLAVCPGPVVRTGGAYVIAPSPRSNRRSARRLIEEFIKMARETVMEGETLLACHQANGSAMTSSA